MFVVSRQIFVAARQIFGAAQQICARAATNICHGATHIRRKVTNICRAATHICRAATHICGLSAHEAQCVFNGDFCVNKFVTIDARINTFYCNFQLRSMNINCADGIFVSDFMKIARRYARTWMSIDVCLVSMDWAHRQVLSSAAS